MKKELLSILVVILWINVSSATNPTEPATMTVVATSGLTLRKAPDLSAPAVKIIPYGDHVIIRDDQPDTIYWDRIDWVDGEWIVVEHGGDIGFVFDGYLTSLPLPADSGEYSPYDMELVYPLEAWMAHHHLLVEAPDTVQRSDRYKIAHNYVDGDRMIQSHLHDYYKVEVYLHDVRLMDAYHLLLSMLDDEVSAATFRDQTTFMEGGGGAITRVKVDLDDRIDIRMMGSDIVRIEIISAEQFCKL